MNNGSMNNGSMNNGSVNNRSMNNRSINNGAVNNEVTNERESRIVNERETKYMKIAKLIKETKINNENAENKLKKFLNK
jgi:hypothetical protein